MEYDRDQVYEKIEKNINDLSYLNRRSFSIIFKIAAFNSIKNLLEKEHHDMMEYLFNNSRKGKYQNKLFKEYVNIIENQLPFTIIKNNKPILIENLLDDNLNIFQGESTFQSKVNLNFKVKNNTSEFYISSRGCSILPFYIGKVISIENNHGLSLLENLDEYNFSEIKMKDISPGTIVNVKHLRTYPHYDMGAMTYINRARKKLINDLK